MIAVIAGATGLVGSYLVQLLLTNTEITSVISVSRKSLNINSPKLKEVIVSDFSKLDQHILDLKGDLYFSCLGTTIKDAGSKENFRKVDFNAIVDFAKIAKANDAKSLTVVSASGANPKSPIFYSKIKGETELALMAQDIPSLVIFRPGLLIGNRKARRPTEKLFIEAFKKISLILPTKLQKIVGTDARLLAQRMLDEAKVLSKETVIIESKDI
ncbi:MAG: NAD-dependent epimerase/dehydratase family protein [Bdellovibrionota bacterium]